MCSVFFTAVFFFSSRRRHTRCALVTGVQTCALPICSTRPAFWTRPPSSMRWRVRSRRATTHPLVSVRRAAASSLFLACASLPCAFTVAASASASLATASLKEGRAPRAPRLLFVRVGRFHSGEQRTGERVQIERIGPGGRDQLAELLDLAGLQSLGLVVQRPQFRVIVAHLSHLLSLAPMNGAAA